MGNILESIYNYKLNEDKRLNESSYVRDNDSFTTSYLSIIEKELDKYDFPTHGVDPDFIESTKQYDDFPVSVNGGINIDPEYELIYAYIEIKSKKVDVGTLEEKEFNLSEIEKALVWCESKGKEYAKIHIDIQNTLSDIKNQQYALRKKYKKLPDHVYRDLLVN